MQNVYNFIGWNSVHISDIFLKLLPCKYQWNMKRKKATRDNIWIYTNLKIYV